MCLFPKDIKLRLKNGRVVVMRVPCGKCIECLNTRVSDWVYRLKVERALHLHSVFVTLTYDDFFLPVKGVQVTDLQKHFKRLRKHFKSQLRYFAIGEYGTKTNRAHYHYILFYDDDITLNQCRDFIGQSWHFGFNVVKSLTQGRIVYCISYLKAQHSPVDMNKPFCVMSKRPAIGSQLLDDENFCKTLIQNNFEFVIQQGKKVHCPRYYKKKLDFAEFKPIDAYLLRCKYCKTTFNDKLEYLKKLPHIRDPDNFLSPFRSNLPDWLDFQFWRLMRNYNKDYTLKQRNKKTRLL